MIPAAAVAALAIGNVRSRRWPGSAEGHFRGMADRSSDVVWSTRDLPKPHVTYLSPAFEALTGLTAAHLDSHPALLSGLFGWPGPTRPQNGATSSSDIPVTCADGRVVLLEVTRTVVPDGLEGTARDVTAERAARDRLTHRADTDPLTGLANRTTFVRRLDELLVATEGTDETVTVAFLDLDDFKTVNDQHGHAAGDVVLIQTARRLERAVRAGDIVARAGGDEFVVAQVRGPAGRGNLAGRLTSALDLPIDLDGVAHEAGAEGVSVTCLPCIGIADTGSGERDSESLIRAADKAMYRLKAVRAIADHASTQLAKGRHEFPQVMAALADGVVLRDSVGRVVECNPAAEQMLGQSLDADEGALRHRSGVVPDPPRRRGLHRRGDAQPNRPRDRGDRQRRGDGGPHRRWTDAMAAGQCRTAVRPRGRTGPWSGQHAHRHHLRTSRPRGGIGTGPTPGSRCGLAARCDLHPRPGARSHRSRRRPAVLARQPGRGAAVRPLDRRPHRAWPAGDLPLPARRGGVRHLPGRARQRRALRRWSCRGPRGRARAE